MSEETKRLDLSSKVYNLVLIIVAIVIVFCAGNLYYNLQTLPQNYPQEISISGQGKVYAKPDVALVALGLKSTGKTVAQVVEDNTGKMNKIISDVKALGVDEKDIQTTQYSITPDYNWTEDRGRIFEGYVLMNQVSVKIRDFGKIGSILDKATSSGANEVGDLQFTIDNPESVQAEARQKAIDQAKEKAQVLAGQSGLKLVKLINISEGGYYPQPSYGKGGGVMMESASVAPQIESGQMEINSMVTLTYRVR